MVERVYKITQNKLISLNYCKNLIFRIQKKILRILYSYFDYFDNILSENALNENLTIRNRLNFDFFNEINTCLPEAVINNYIEHRFDILGSTWVNFNTINTRTTLSNYSKNILSLINNKSYININWHIDIKSGYNWNHRLWSKKIKIIEDNSIDIKVPWELSRMQHLPQLALHYRKIINDENRSSIIFNECRNQIIDFIGNNITGFGVNWVCNMDVSIRCINLLVTYDILTYNNETHKLDIEFKNLFANSIFSHLKFIINNLEADSKYQGNHYLFNIAGILFATSYLNINELNNNNSHFLFALQEFKNSFDIQFNDDGTHFEGSTCYHKFCTDLYIYTTALICGIDRTEFDFKNIKMTKYRNNFKLKIETINLFKKNEKYKFINYLGDNFFHKLYLACDFIIKVSTSEDNLIQIGDNDSGKFLSLDPNYILLEKNKFNSYYKSKNFNFNTDTVYYFENNLTIKSFKNCKKAIFDNDSYINHTVEYNFLKSISNNSINLNFKNHNLKRKLVMNDFDFDSLYKNTNSTNKAEYLFNLEVDDFNPNLFIYLNFGVIIYKTINITFGIIIRNSYDGCGAHLHNDKLSIFLNNDGNDIIYDPGSFVYTSNRSIRNKYRSVLAHFTPQEDNKEPESLNEGIFSLSNTSKINIIFCTKNKVLLEHYSSNFKYFREVKFSNSNIIIRDISIHNPILYLKPNTSNFSTGYGWEQEIK